MALTITLRSYSTRITNVYCLDHLSPVSQGVARTGKEQVDSAKSTNNPMSSFGLFE